MVFTTFCGCQQRPSQTADPVSLDLPVHECFLELMAFLGAALIRLGHLLYSHLFLLQRSFAQLIRG